jgi:DNA helicase-2/ATP-dependent DNA helicase PcrA
MPEASVPSRFLEEVPPQLIEELGARSTRTTRSSFTQEPTHYAYEDEDQSVSWPAPSKQRIPTPQYGGKTYNSIDNIAEFFASRGKKFSVPKVPVEEPKGKKGFRPGQKVRHPKYGEGMVFQREGEGEDSRITVQFPRFGLKKLVEKYAQLEAV